MHNTSQTDTLLEHIKNCENSITHLINQRLGIVIHKHQISDLHKTILEACYKFNCTPENYLQTLSKCSYDSPILTHLVSCITIGETYFFRDKNQMRFLQEILLPQLIAGKRKLGELSLRIWSAGCATGEEIYTILMMLHEMLPDYKHWTLQLMGTDINTASLKKAMLGNYTQWSMRTIPEHFKSKYFNQENNYYQLVTDLLKTVNFSYLNLNDECYPSISNGTNAQDLILCCNVLIYFDAEHTKALMKKLSNSLVPGGYLMLGASDPVLLSGTNLVPHHHHGVYFTYSEQEPKQPPKLISKMKSPLPIIETISKKLAPQEVSEKKTALQIDTQQISKLPNESNWQEALNAISTYDLKASKSVFLYNAKATAQANLGKLQQALESCYEALLIDATNKHTYFTNALILLELNKLDEAEALFRKALFLDHQFVEAHFQLGLLLLRKKKHDIGIKSLQNAFAIAKNKKPTELVSEYHGLDYRQLADILDNEINMYLASQERSNGKNARSGE